MRTPSWLVKFTPVAVAVVLLAANVLFWQRIKVNYDYAVAARAIRKWGPRPNAVLRLYVPASSAVLVSVMILGCVVYITRKAQQAFIPDELREVIPAGQWVLQQALGRPAHAKTKSLDGDTSGRDPLIQQLDEWYFSMKRNVEREIRARTEEMQRDLSLATDFQRAMLERPYPVVPDVHVRGRLRLNFYHRYQPASALGGDFFNILKLGPDAGAVFIADVMGHGTRSALITSILRTLIGDLMAQGRNAPHFLSEMNAQFCDLLQSVPAPLFASAFYFVADTTSRMATFSAAGHPPPFHVKRSVGRVLRLDVPPPRATALGVIPDERFPGGKCRMIDEDVFIFFTDGVFEAFNRQGDEFGVKRMEKTIRQHLYKDVASIVDALHDAVLEFAGDEPVADDMCIVAVEVTSRPAEKEKV